MMHDTAIAATALASGISPTKSPSNASGQSVLMVRRFRTWLAETGYQDALLAFNPLYLGYWRQANAYQMMGADLSKVYRLFALGGQLTDDEVRIVPAELAAWLEQRQVLVSQLGLWSLGERALVLAAGNWLLCGLPAVNPRLGYFGEDSLALLLRLSPTPGGRALDLCSGPGIQALQASHFSREVVTVEKDESLRATIEFNLELNSRSAQVLPLFGDLYEALDGHRGCKFDDILSNPPLVPVPDTLPFAPAAHGGPDGMRLIWKILDGLPQHLAAGGQAQIIGCTVSDGLLPNCADDLASWSERTGLRAVMTISRHLPVAPGKPFFTALAQTAVLAGHDRWDAAMAYDKCFTQQHASHICCFHLRVVDGGQPGFLLTDPSRPGERSNTTWFR